jgi:hypothetical protein
MRKIRLTLLAAAIGLALAAPTTGSADTLSETRSYTPISNIMKTKHDTVKNSISNVR